MARTAKALVFLLGLGAAAPAWAATISVGPIKGDTKKATLRGQLATLCGPPACVPFSKVSTKGKVDPAKARKAGAAAVLTGQVKGKGKGRALSLQAHTTSTRPARTWSLPLAASGTLDKESIELLRRDLRSLLGEEEPPPPQAKAVPLPPPPVLPPPPAAAAAPAALEAQAPAKQAPAKQAPAKAAPPPAAPPPTGRAGPSIAGEVGAYLTNRTLAFQGAASGTSLRSFDVSMVVSPRLRLEGYPFPASWGALAKGVGLFADYSRSVGLTTEVQVTGEKRDTTFTHLQAGLLWRVPLGPVTLVPAVSYQRSVFEVSSPIPGLADSDLVGYQGWLGIEIPLGWRLTGHAGGGYTKWTQAQDLIKGNPVFFPGDSASGLELEGGLGLGLTSSLSLRAILEYRKTTYKLAPDPSGTYVADGATDTYVGGRVMFRFEF